MLVNSDFRERVAVTPDCYRWVDSNQPGVRRMMLDRIGEEQARATSLVQYAKGAHFPHHFHPGGEEILVLSGTFSEDDSHYPAGWYLRNPPGSKHQPFSPDGTTIFVKLRQMNASERLPLRINTNDSSNWVAECQQEKCTLFTSQAERVWLQRLQAGAQLNTAGMVGLELLVLRGEIAMESAGYPSGSWIRLPIGDMPILTANQPDTTLYIKTGHLQGAV